MSMDPIIDSETTRNGTHERPSMIQEALGQLSDHVDLLALELRYETDYGFKRLASVMGALFLAFFAFALLQVTLVAGLVRLGMPMWGSCLLLAVLYSVGAGILIKTMGHRDPRVGQPFEATQREIKATIRWIQKLFS